MSTTPEYDPRSVTTVVERGFQTTLPSALDLPDFIPFLMRCKGIIAVMPDRSRSVVRVRYDVRQVNFADIQTLLAQAGAPALDGFIQRWRSEWFVNLDTTIRDNAAHSSACCSRPRVGAGRGSHRRGRR